MRGSCRSNGMIPHSGPMAATKGAYPTRMAPFCLVFQQVGYAVHTIQVRTAHPTFLTLPGGKRLSRHGLRSTAS